MYDVISTYVYRCWNLAHRTPWVGKKEESRYDDDNENDDET